MNLQQEIVKALFVLGIAPPYQGAKHRAQEAKRQRHHGWMTSCHSATAPRIAGPIIARTTDDTNPIVMPLITPPVLKRRTCATIAGTSAVGH